MIPDLADLRAPAQGIAELPLRLLWSAPDRRFDLGDREALRLMYETVLREAIHHDELTGYLNGDTLIAVWRELYLPAGVRQAWEEHHPALRAVAAA